MLIPGAVPSKMPQPLAAHLPLCRAVLSNMAAASHKGLFIYTFLKRNKMVKNQFPGCSSHVSKVLKRCLRLVAAVSDSAGLEPFHHLQSSAASVLSPFITSAPFQKPLAQTPAFITDRLPPSRATAELTSSCTTLGA